MMKKIGSYTCRGSMKSTTVERVILFDGRFDTGYVVTKFMIVVDDPDNSGLDGYGILATQADMGTTWDLSDGTQVGWASMNNGGGATGPSAEPFELIDRDNLVVEDLHVYAETNAAGLNAINYYIEMDKYEFTDSRGALAMVRNKSQA
jgi:hypothetical protein